MPRVRWALRLLACLETGRVAPVQPNVALSRGQLVTVSTAGDTISVGYTLLLTIIILEIMVYKGIIIMVNSRGYTIQRGVHQQ